MKLGPGARGDRSATRAFLATLLIAGALISVPLPGDDTVVQPVRAQLEECGALLSLPECSFEISLDMDDSGTPGSFVNGTLTISNTGDGSDSYTISVSTDNENWTETEADPGETEAVAPDESAEVEIVVLVPEESRVGESATITVNVTSQNGEDLFEEATADVSADQTYGWVLACDDTVTIQKGQEGSVMLTASNTGNGPDTASVDTRPLPDGITVATIEDFEAGPGELQDQNVTIEVGIGLDEGEYTIDWDLASQGDAGTTDTCSTTLTATVGGDGDGGDDGEEEDSPLPAALVILAAFAAALVARRRREKDA